MAQTLIVVTPWQRCNAQLAIAAARFGELGVLDLGSGRPDGCSEALASLLNNLPANSDRWGLRWDALGADDRGLGTIEAILKGRKAPLLVLAGTFADAKSLSAACASGKSLATRVFVEITTVEEARAAEQAGCDGVIAKGNEASGWVGPEGTFLLLQRLRGALRVPYYAQGGIGPDTAAAAILAGAAGVVLCEQLWLATESPFKDTERTQWRQFDGSETVSFGRAGRAYRFCSRYGRVALVAAEKALVEGDEVYALVGKLLLPEAPAADQPFPLGQDIAFAARLADRHVNVAGILGAYRKRIRDNVEAARTQHALSSDGPLAKAHKTRYPILQGPMTRVSDVAPFALAVAESGALPFLALALMTGPEVRRLLTETRQKLGQRPWGIGLLGFVPPELLKAQLEVIYDVAPPYALVAGGRPAQARELEARGISTYLHVPSPALLDAFLAEGCRKFIFEGRECGGHVGPRSSFCLWQSAIDVLVAAELPHPEEVHVIFAGGIHDALSAAMVAVLAAPLVARGMKIGVLMGTAYLFTHEAVRCGAITAEFQRQALTCEETVLLESGFGHATRAARSPFAEEFQTAKDELVRSGKSSEEVRMALELLNVGRLRVASKGLMRPSSPSDPLGKAELKAVDETVQRQAGLYMIGQVATLRREALPLEKLHAEVCQGGDKLVADLAQTATLHAVPAAPRPKQADIAIVGMSCFFPKADDVRGYWQNICNRVNAVEEVPPQRWRVEDYFSTDRFARDRVYSRWGGFLGKVTFDPIKWHVPPASLRHVEPVQLLALEAAGRAMADAGYDRREFPRERTGVLFAVAGSHDLGTAYCVRTMLRHHVAELDGPKEAWSELMARLEDHLPEWTEDTFPGFLSNVVAGRIARELNLGGPNYVVDAACAAALAALHAGIEQLRSGTSDMVLVGGADLTNNPFCYMSFAKTFALSPRGRSRPFDDTADGISLGEGVACVILKRLADAERDGDRIYAVIKGIGASSDGKQRSLTAPSPQGQTRALERAYEDAQVSPASVTLIEAHGTGTPVGDAAELTALSHLYQKHQAARHTTAVGSVKSMIGHTKTVAGLAGLIKTALALKHRVLPPTIGVEKPTTKVDLSSGSFYISTEARPWVAEDGAQTATPRRAGVSAFGFGGTNFHVVLEEHQGAFHPAHNVDLTPRPVEVFFFRHTTREELLAALRGLRDQLAAGGGDFAGLAAAAWREDEARKHANRPCRLALVAASMDDLRAKLEKALGLLVKGEAINDPTGIYYGEGNAPRPESVCFLYPGQGPQRVDMLRELLLVSPWALELFGRANRLLADLLPGPLSRCIYPIPAFDETTRQSQRQTLDSTDIAQPALGVTELFATELLGRFGLRPGCTAGHSFGELLALHAAGCIEADDLLRVAAMRGRICAQATRTTPGGMVAVAAGPEATQAALKQCGLAVEVANLNGPDQTVIAGPDAVLATAVEQLPKKGLRARKLPVSAPFHTTAMRPAAQEFGGLLAKVPLARPSLPVYSNTTGQRHADDPAAIRDALVRHLCEPVRFAEVVQRLHADGASIFVEVGPGRVLCDLVSRILPQGSVAVLPLDVPGRDGREQLCHLLGRLMALGLPVQLGPWFAGRSVAVNSLDEHFARARIEAKVRPTDWIISHGRAEPMTPLPGTRPAKAPAPPSVVPGSPTTNGHVPAAAPVAPPVQAQQTPPPPRPSISVPLVPSTQRLSSLPTGSPTPLRTPAPMNTTHHEASSNGTCSAPAHYGAELFAQFQATTRQLLEMQQGQQRLFERYLETQERFLASCLNGAPAPAALAALPLPAAPAPQAAPVRVPAVAPARPPVVLPGNGAAARNAPPVKAPAPQTVVAVPAPTPVTVPVPVPGAQNGTALVPAPSTNGDTGAIPAPPPPEAFRDDLLRVVSERTGYPIDMLDESLPLEAGLGIDSIKTVEIFSKLKNYHVYIREVAKDQDEEAVLVAFTKLKTLKDIIASYTENRRLYLERQSGAAPAATTTPALPAPAAAPQQSATPVERYVLNAVSAAEPGALKKKLLTAITSSSLETPVT